jgi:hypothetical protein
MRHHVPTVQVTSRIEIDFEEVLQGMARLQMQDLERFVDRVIALQAQRRAPSLPKQEAELLQKINQGLPIEVRRRYAELNDKLHEETITPEEHQELLQLASVMRDVKSRIFIRGRENHLCQNKNPDPASSPIEVLPFKTRQNFSRLYRLQQIRHHAFGIAEEHHGFLVVK